MFHELPIWAYLMIVLGLTHVTIAAVTIFLHRNQAHHALELHPFCSHFFRFWLWLTTGIVTREWEQFIENTMLRSKRSTIHIVPSRQG